MKKIIIITLIGVSFPLWVVPVSIYIIGRTTYEAFESGIIP